MLLELGLLNVLEHHALRSHFPHDSLVVREIEGRGANPVGSIAGGKDLVDHSNRCERAQLRIAVLVFQRKIVLDLLEYDPRTF